MERLAFVIPFHNEAANLPLLLKRLTATSGQIEAEMSVAVSLVFIDDGSSDDGFELLSGQDFNGREAQLLRFSRNFGKEAALSAGIEAASHYDAAILMDADLQHPPELSLEFIRCWRDEGYDTVFAYKNKRVETEGRFRALLSFLFYRVINHGARFHIPQDAGDFRLLSRPVCEALMQMPESERFMKGLYGWVGFRQKGISYTPEVRAHGQSKFRPAHLLAMTLDAMTSFSTAPLRLMAFSGLVISVLSILYGLFIIFERLLFNTNPSGTASILTMIAFFGGAQMIFMGILGEYVGKTILEAKRRPAFIIRDNIVVNRRSVESDG